MRYLYIDSMDADPKQTDIAPSEQMAEAVIDGEITIYRFNDGKFEIMTPIDRSDIDNWSIVEEFTDEICFP